MKKTTYSSDIIDALSLPDLCRFCQTDEAWVIEMVDYGVLEPEGETSQNWRFYGVSIARAKKASRLWRDLGINTAGLAMVLSLLEEREAILRRLAQHDGD
jgi:chaperone modulatory protein CbpM